MTTGKRAFDLALLALFVLPALVAAAILATVLLLVQGRPVLHGSTRMRAPGRPFTLWKFRTMRPDPADSGITAGHKSDRITPAGLILRRTRLDELPQLWNILAGDMSFVGPRPPLPEIVASYPALYGRVLQCRPGLTGLATLLYRRTEARLLAGCRCPRTAGRIYADRCVPAKGRLDLFYRRKQSLALDLAVLCGTFAGLGHLPFRWRLPHRLNQKRAKFAEHSPSAGRTPGHDGDRRDRNAATPAAGKRIGIGGDSVAAG